MCRLSGAQLAVEYIVRQCVAVIAYVETPAEAADIGRWVLAAALRRAGSGTGA